MCPQVIHKWIAYCIFLKSWGWNQGQCVPVGLGECPERPFICGEQLQSRAFLLWPLAPSLPGRLAMTHLVCPPNRKDARQVGNVSQKAAVEAETGRSILVSEEAAGFV